MSAINREGNRIVVLGDLSHLNFHLLLALLHQAVEKAGYADLQLDMQKCTAAFPGSVLAVVAQLRHSGIYCRLELPEERRLRSLFLNANWAHFLDPRSFDPSKFKGSTRLPATQFKSPMEQHTSVNRIIDTILGAIPEMERDHFAAFEWAINELTDNVLTHAQSLIGGYVQVSTFQKNKKRVEFVVADAGIGIPSSLRESFPNLTSDTEALDKAIREGVTRDKSIGQGNGLFGSWRICSYCDGHFEVQSGRARLLDTSATGLHVYTEKIPYSGTLIVATIDFTDPNLLREALKFGGEPHKPVDYIETHYENPVAEEIHFRVRSEATSLGSRPAGTPVRTKLLNLSRMAPSQRIVLNFEDISLISSSFADEVFGKLFVEVGPIAFMQKFQFRNVSPMVREIVDRAIQQRSKQ